MEKKVNVAAYCRVSTDKEDQANSLASQMAYFKRYIEAHREWSLFRIYYDEGISGTGIRRRQGFLSMIQDALDGEVSLILTKEVSRFARNTVDTLEYTRKLKYAGVGVVFTIDNIDTRDCDGELRLTIMASIAQEESRKTSERVKWGQRRQMEQGKVFGRDLLGYRVQNGKLFINEAEAPVVRSVFHKYTNEGKGAAAIARELTAEGLLSKEGKPWSSASIGKILCNEKYAGDLCQKKTITPDYLTHAKRYNHGEEDLIYIENHHAPLISREMWNRTQEERMRRLGGKKQRAGQSRSWCSGRLYCSVCKSRYVSRTKKRKDGSVYRCFRCEKNVREGGGKTGAGGKKLGCSNHQISEQTLLACMRFAATHLKADIPGIKKEILRELKALQGVSPANAPEEKTKEELAHLTEKKQKAVDLLLRGLLTEEELVQQKAWYDEKIRTLQKRLESSRAGNAVSGVQETEAGAYKEAVDKILAFEEQEELLYQEITEKIVLYPDHRLELWLKGMPFSLRINFENSGRGKSFAVKITGLEVWPEETPEPPESEKGKKAGAHL